MVFSVPVLNDGPVCIEYIGQIVAILLSCNMSEVWKYQKGKTTLITLYVILSNINQFICDFRNYWTRDQAGTKIMSAGFLWAFY